MASTVNKTYTLAILAFQKAIELGYTHIEATDLMDQFQIIADDRFGFRQYANNFIFTYNYAVPINILAGSIGYNIPNI